MRNRTIRSRDCKKRDTPKCFAIQGTSSPYIGDNSHPYKWSNVQLISPGLESTTNTEYRSFNKVVEYLRDKKEVGFRFVKHDWRKLKLVVIKNQSYKNTNGLRRLLGYVMIMGDAEGRANIVLYGSSQCLIETSYVMVSEINDLMHEFDNGILFKKLLSQIINRSIEIQAIVDRKSGFDIIETDGRRTERRLKMDVHASKESYQ